MSLSLATITYIPPSSISPKVCNPGAFVENITKFKTRYPLVAYSDGNWSIADLKIGNPELSVNPDVKLKNGWPNQFVLNNLIFFTGLRVALRRGFTHIIYLEADCRVGCDLWDEALFDFHFKHPEPLVASGTAVAFNVSTGGREALARWKQWSDAQKMVPGFACPSVYGWRGQSTTTEKPTVFVNGALGVYSVAWLKKIFGMDGLPPGETKDSCRKLAEDHFAWDFSVGYELWKLFGIESFSLIANNPKVYSGFGDVLTSPAERLELLRNGTCVGVHQIKGPEVL